ncbi:hypothetical protein MMPV_002931 [Pyropia vietnamensis]
MPLRFPASPVHKLSGNVAASAMAGGRVPCDYNVTNTVLVDERSCITYKCGLARHYRVSQRVNMWAPGTPKSKMPLFYYTIDYLCTPTRMLVGPAQHRKAGRHPLTCLAMWSPEYANLCAHAPATPGCGWESKPRLTEAAAAAIKTGVPPPQQAYITQCRVSPVKT